MKKLFAGVLAAALALSVLTASAFAAPGANYVDADGDGVCDYFGQGGRYYVDADGDGVCDNYNGGARGGAGRGRGGRR